MYIVCIANSGATVARADSLKTNPSHMCYHVTFGCSATKDVRINRREPHNWRRLEPALIRVGAWMSLKN